MNDPSQESPGQRVRVGALRSITHGTLGLSEPVLRAMVGSARISADGMVLDLQTQVILWLMERAGLPLMHEHPVDIARREMDRTAPILAPKPVRAVSSLDRTIDTAGGSLSARVYQPVEGEGPRGVLVYFHGGGWVLGSIDSHDGVCASIASRADCVVVSVAYRMAPEHRFPAAVDDAVAAFRAIASSLGAYGGDGGRVAVAGDSAGGNLAAVVALETRNDAVAPRLQVLIYPATDATRSGASHGLFPEGYLLTKAGIDFYLGHYLGSSEQARDPRVSPLFAESVSGAAPAFVLTAGFDPLRDEGRAYAERLRAAGVTTRYHCYEGMIHGFLSMAGGITAAEDSLRDVADALREAFARPV